MSDRRPGSRMGLRLLALPMFLIALSCLYPMLFALNSDSSMYEMVQNAYKVTLVAAFTPLVFGMFWRGATPQGALVSIVFGLGTWVAMERIAPEGLFPPQLVGLGAAIFGMVAGSLAPPIAGGRACPRARQRASAWPGASLTRCASAPRTRPR